MPESPKARQLPALVNGTGNQRVNHDDPTGLLPFVVSLDDADTPYDVIDALVLAPFVAGRHPWAATSRLDRVRPDASLVPPGAQVLRTVVEDDREAKLASGDGWTLRAVRWRSGGGEVTVTAVDEETGRTVLKQAVEDASAEPPAPEDAVRMGFWYLSARRGGPYRTTRSINAQPWEEISRNYAAPAAQALGQLMAVDRDDVQGRLILLHGPPGTGKTSVLRTLAREWRDWCGVDFVLDPEVMFGDTGYLTDVAIGRGGDEEDTEKRWRLLVLEDCDELIRGDAKRAAGQSLSRLLNLTDGLLGQGRNVLVAITTNEGLDRLHPAVVRPGRCLAQIGIGSLSEGESRQWLGGEQDEVHGPRTLAELYAVRSGGTPVEAKVPETDFGMYL